MNYVQFHVGDWDSSTRLLSPLEKGIYIDLLMLYYSVERPLMRSECERISRAYAPEEKTALEYVLNRFFHLEGDAYAHHRCDEEIARAAEKSEKASKSAKARWNKGSKAKAFPVADANDMQNGCERNTDVDADGMRAHSERSADGMLTNNQEPIYKESIKKASAMTHRFALTSIPPEWMEYASKVRPDLDAEKEFTSFAFYFTSGKGSSKLRSDKGWSQAWQGWVRRAKEHAQHSQPTNMFTVIKPRQPENRDDDFDPDFDMDSFGLAK